MREGDLPQQPDFAAIRRDEVTRALTAFADLQAGKREVFFDGTGLRDDGEPAVEVTAANVQAYEQHYRRRWAGTIAMLEENQANG